MYSSGCSLWLVVEGGGLLIAAVLRLAITGVWSDERLKLECIWYLFLGNPRDTKKSRRSGSFRGSAGQYVGAPLLM